MECHGNGCLFQSCDLEAWGRGIFTKTAQGRHRHRHCDHNSKELLQAVADALGMQDYIDYFLTGNEVERGKPAPDIYLKVAEHLGVQPNDCLVFEDICPGIMAAKNAGMKVCAVYDDYSKDITAEKKTLADYYITDYRQID